MSQNHCPQDPSCRAPQKTLTCSGGRPRPEQRRTNPMAANTKKCGQPVLYFTWKIRRRTEKLQQTQQIFTIDSKVTIIYNYHSMQIRLACKTTFWKMCVFFFTPKLYSNCFFCPSPGGDPLLVATTDSPTLLLSWELSHIPRPLKGTFESMIIHVFLSFGGIWFLAPWRVVLWTWIKKTTSSDPSPSIVLGGHGFLV